MAGLGVVIRSIVAVTTGWHPMITLWGEEGDLVMEVCVGGVLYNGLYTVVVLITASK